MRGGRDAGAVSGWALVRALGAVAVLLVLLALVVAAEAWAEWRGRRG